jgi:hypothetical protein
MTALWGRARGGPLDGQTIADNEKTVYVNVHKNLPRPIINYLPEKDALDAIIEYDVGTYTLDEDRKIWDWKLQ